MSKGASISIFAPGATKAHPEPRLLSPSHAPVANLNDAMGLLLTDDGWPGVQGLAGPTWNPPPPVCLQLVQQKLWPDFPPLSSAGPAAAFPSTSCALCPSGLGVGGSRIQGCIVCPDVRQPGCSGKWVNRQLGARGPEAPGEGRSPLRWRRGCRGAPGELDSTLTYRGLWISSYTALLGGGEE